MSEPPDDPQGEEKVLLAARADHLASCVTLATSPTFTETFGDLRMVFLDGQVHHYRYHSKYKHGLTVCPTSGAYYP